MIMTLQIPPPLISILSTVGASLTTFPALWTNYSTITCGGLDLWNLWPQNSATAQPLLAKDSANGAASIWRSRVIILTRSFAAITAMWRR